MSPRQSYNVFGNFDEIIFEECRTLDKRRKICILLIIMEEILIEEKNEFIEYVDKESGEKIESCFQCGRCSGSCPVSEFMDYTPRQINQLIKLGKKDLIFSANTIWICASCITCTVRCPREIDLAKVMDALRIIAQKEKRTAKVKEVPIFHKTFLKSIRRYGRVNEIQMMSEYNLLRKNYFKNLKSYIKLGLNLAPKMLLSGKINPLKIIFSDKIKELKTIEKIFKATKVQI